MTALRCRIVLVAAVVVLGAGQSDADLTATFLGNQAFRITDGETILFTDFPYESGAYGYMSWDKELLQPTEKSYCLITHRHRDHFASELVERVGCTVVGPPSVVALLDGAESIEATGEIAIGPLTITPLDTPHNVEHRSYRVEWGDLSLYFTGDTETVDVLRDQDRLDVLFTSPWLFESALRRDALPEAEQIIIYHHRADQLVSGCRPCTGEPGCTSCSVPVQGRTFSFSAGDE